MTFYICMLFLIAIIMMPNYSKNIDKNYKKISFYSVTIILIIIVGFRNINVGMGDTANLYIPEFKRIINYNYKFIIENYKDPAFYMISKILLDIFKNIRVLLIIYSSIYIIPVMYLIYKKSPYPILSILMFISLNFFGTAFSGIRHCCACGIIILSFFYLEKRNLKKFIISIIIASLFHITSIIFIIAYPMYNILSKSNKKTYIKLLILTIIIFLLNKIYGKYIIANVLNIIINNFNLSRFEIYAQNNFSSLNNNLFYMNFIMFALVIFFKNKNVNNLKLSLYLTVQIIGLILLSFTTSLGELYRLAYYFIQFSIILVPNYITFLNNKSTNKIIRISISIILIIYFLFFSAKNTSIIPYQFLGGEF